MNKLIINLSNQTAEVAPLTEAEIAARVAAPQPVPASVTMRQMRLWLLQADKLTLVEAAILAIPDTALRQAAKIDWEYATIIERARPLTTSLAQAIGMTPAELDQAFREAEQIL